MQGVIIENEDDQVNIDADSLVIFTLSTSYIAFPKTVIDQMLKDFFPSTLKCKINN
jgi:hypothetical protein